jgi:hypothetical protein
MTIKGQTWCKIELCRGEAEVLDIVKLLILFESVCYHPT